MGFEEGVSGGKCLPGGYTKGQLTGGLNTGRFPSRMLSVFCVCFFSSRTIGADEKTWVESKKANNLKE